MNRTSQNPPMHVLVVEDDSVSAEILGSWLRHFGYEVTTADNGRDAFELVRTGRYRLVVSDWELPGMAWKAAAKSRAGRQLYHVILVTSFEALTTWSS